MTIYMDVSVLTLVTFVTGIQRVTREIAVRLIQQENIEVKLLHYNAAEACYHLIDNKAFREYYVSHKGIKEKMVTKKKVPLEEIGEGTIYFDLDASWLCKMKRSYLLPLLKKQGAKIIAHIYDIISVTHPQYCRESGVYNFMDFIGAHLQNDDLIICNASNTKAELHKLCEKLGIPCPETVIVPLGANFKGDLQVEEHQVQKEVVQAVKSAPYLLMVGTVEPRKNHKLLLQAYREGLKQAGYHVIFAGYMGWNMEDFEADIKADPDYGKGIWHFDGLDDKAIAYLYQNAKYLVFSSYIEGFGLPIVEAIVRGTPVLCADHPVYREVALEYPVWFEQDNAKDLCEKVVELHANPERYEQIKNTLGTYKPVSWEESFAQMLAYLK